LREDWLTLARIALREFLTKARYFVELNRKIRKIKYNKKE